jgi:hypothetical protein
MYSQKYIVRIYYKAKKINFNKKIYDTNVVPQAQQGDVEDFVSENRPKVV